MNLSTEETMMLLITGITNISCFPSLYVGFHKKLYFQFYIGLFTFITSLMYHSLESIHVKRFYLTPGDWHKLDNIGSVQCFIMLLVYFMDNLQRKGEKLASKHNCDLDFHFNMCGLFLTMLMQTNHPWLVHNTYIPILVFAAILFVKLAFVRRSRLNKKFFSKGIVVMAAAVYFFIKGLDDRNDYLRIHHGMWHCCVGIGSFYLWQCIDKDRPVAGVKNLKLVHQPRFELVEVWRRILKLQFFKTQEIVLPHNQ